MFPAIPAGVAPYHGTFPGIFTVSSKTLHSYIHDIMMLLANSSVNTIILANDHGRNGETLAHLARNLTRTTAIDIYLWDWIRTVDDHVDRTGEIETASSNYLLISDTRG